MLVAVIDDNVAWLLTCPWQALTAVTPANMDWLHGTCCHYTFRRPLLGYNGQMWEVIMRPERDINKMFVRGIEPVDNDDEDNKRREHSWGQASVSRAIVHLADIGTCAAQHHLLSLLTVTFYWVVRCLAIIKSPSPVPEMEHDDPCPPSGGVRARFGACGH